jgi:hypothetical protein
MQNRRWLPWQSDGDPSRRWLALAWGVLVAYRALKLFVGQERALSSIEAFLSHQFRKHTGSYLEERFGIVQARPDEAFERIAENYRERGELLFGPRFTYVQAVDTNDESHTHITKCLFNDFFRAHHALEAARIFCALDSVWVDELHRPRYRTRFARPTTLAAGADACRFQFSRAAKTVGPTR